MPYNRRQRAAGFRGGRTLNESGFHDFRRLRPGRARRLGALLGLAALATLALPADAAAWWNGAWTKRRKITFDNSAQAQNLDGFPVLVALNSSRIDYSRTQDAGQDLRFVDADDQTPLDHEIELWNEAGTSYVWVRVPRIDASSTTDFVYMYYGNPLAGDGQNPSGVWDAGFTMVQHLNETTGAHTDSTANGNHSVVVNVQAPQGAAAGQVDGADAFVRASAHRIEIPDAPSLDIAAGDSFTVEAWVKTSFTSNFQVAVSKEPRGIPTEGELQLWTNFAGEAAFWLADGAGQIARATSVVDVADGSWRYLVGRWTEATSTVALFVDGVSVATGTNALLGSLATTTPLLIGEEGDGPPGGGNWDGLIDEVRVSKAARSNEWIRAQNLSMRDSFASFGPDASLATAPRMRVRSGSYTGNTADDRPIFVGFQPDVVVVDRNDPAAPPANEAVIRTSTMAGDSSKNFDDGTPTALASNLIQSLDPLGFTVGTHNNVNQNGIVYHWVAFQAAPGELAVGVYAGSAAAQNVTTVGFPPAYVLVFSEGAQNAVQKTAAMPATFSQDFVANGYTNAILDLRTDGFRVGTSAIANQGGSTYHYVAWGAVPGRAAVGSYTGGTPGDDRSIPGTGFFPEWVVVSRSSNAAGGQANAPVHKPASTGVSTDSSLLFTSTVAQADNIQALQPDGFQVGAAPRVNASTLPNTYHWAAFGPHEPQVHYRSIGNPAPYTAGTILATNGSNAVSGTGTAWVAANRGRGDVITICDDPPLCTVTGDYTVLGVASDTALTLTSPYAGGTGGGKSYVMRRQLSTLAAWEDCVDGPGGTACPFFPVASNSLVADDRSEVGIAYDDSVFVLAAPLDIDGAATDATHTITLTADAGNRHLGLAGGGVVIDNGGNLGPAIRVRDDHVTLEWLEIRGGSGAGADAIEADNQAPGNLLVLRSLLLHDNGGRGIELRDVDTNADVLNNVVYRSNGGIALAMGSVAGQLRVANNTVFGSTLASPGISSASGTNASVLLRNNLSHSNAVDFAVPGPGATSGSNLSSDTTAPGTGSLTAQTLADVRFKSTAPTLEDLHIEPGSTAADSGVDLAALLLVDIDADPRTTPWDIGADEIDASADLAVSKTDGATSKVPGDVITYTITVTNNGPATIDSLKLVDAVPAAILGAAFSPLTGSYDPGTGRWTFPSLAPTQSIQMLLSGTIDPFARTSLTNNATVFPPSGMTDPDGLNDFAGDTDTLDPSADVRVTKIDDVAPAAKAPLGGLVTYTITVTNDGPSGATNVTVSDPLPVGLDLDTAPGAVVASQGSCSYLAGTRTVSCSLGDLAPTGSATVTVKVRPDSIGSFTNTASASLTEPDPDALDNSATETTEVEVTSLDVPFFTATSRSERNVLEWLNPTDADYDTTEVRWSTVAPPNQVTEGNFLYSGGSAGTRDKVAHATGPGTNGQVFYYAAFVHRTAAPTVSAGRFLSARPFDTSGPVKWSFTTGAAALTPPTVGGAGVIAPSNDNALYAMERGLDADQIGVDSGEWPASFEPIDVGKPVQGRSPVVPLTIGGSNPVIFVGSQDGSVYAIDANFGGAAPPLWVQPIGPMVQAAPAGIFGGFGSLLDYVLVGTYDSGGSAFVALEPDTGLEAERFDNTGFGEIGVVSAMAAVEYGPPVRIYLTSREHPTGSSTTLWCFELKEAPDPVWNLLWERQLGHIESSPIIRGGRVYVGGDGAVYSLDAATGGDQLAFVHGNGQVKGFVFPDRASSDLYFATNDYVWGVTDTGVAITNKFGAPLSLGAGVRPSGVLFVPGSHYVLVGGSDGRLYQLDTLGGPLASVVLGDGSATVGAPSLDNVYDLAHVGTEAGIYYAVQLPLSGAGQCVQAAACSSLNPGQACFNSNSALECSTHTCQGPSSCLP